MSRRKAEKLIPSVCEICECALKATLHKHHIVERTDPNCTNHIMNLAVLCSNCHNLVHAKTIKIIGLFPSTKLPYKRTLVYEIDGKSNAPGLENPPFTSKTESMRVFYESEK